MKFNPDTLPSGATNPHRWVAVGKDYRYAIASYIWRKRGDQVQSVKEPYFRAYSYPGGVSIDGSVEYSSLKAAIVACEVHYGNQQKR